MLVRVGQSMKKHPKDDYIFYEPKFNLSNNDDGSPEVWYKKLSKLDIQSINKNIKIGMVFDIMVYEN